jgi:hypothetical protein
MAMATFATLAGFGLAVYLFVIGIMMLRDSPRGRRLHQIYACLELVLILMSVWAAWWLTDSFTGALAASGTSPVATFGIGKVVSMMVLVPHVAVAVLGGCYAIALLITLQSAGVKDFYRTSEM